MPKCALLAMEVRLPSLEKALRLKPQTLPDAINQENFGDIILPRQGKRTYRIQYAYDKIK